MMVIRQIRVPTKGIVYFASGESAIGWYRWEGFNGTNYWN